MRIISLILFFGYALQISAQISLESNGDIPLEIFSSTSYKYELKRKQALDSSFYEPRAVRLARVQFYQKSYYLIDAIKNNANIYINDSYTKLINQIADKLLIDDPELRSQVFLYAYRAPYVNAFSTDQGDIFFTVGLLAHVESEAELAFVVGHEIMHYLKQHNTASFNERVKISRGEGQYQGLAISQGLEEIHSFSRDLEKEADLLSLDYYLKTNYDPQAVISALSMLRTAHLGYNNTEFDYSRLLGSGFELPQDIIPEEIPIMEQDSSDDELSTHPNITARIAYCNEQLDGIGVDHKQLFSLLNESDFQLLRYLARKEQLIQLFDKHYYAKGIYNASTLLESNMHDTLWLKAYINKSFKAAVKLRNRNYNSDERENAEYTGELYRVYHLLYELKKSETASLLFLKEFYESAPSFDTNTKEEVEFALVEMIKGYSSNWKIYLKQEFDTSKIKTSTMDHLLPKLRDVFYSDVFKSNFKDIGLYSDPDKDEKSVLFSDENAIPLTVSKVIVFNPYYLRIDPTVEDYVDYTKSYENEPKLINAIKDATAANGMEAVILDVRDVNQGEGDKFDDIAVLTAYINRFAANGMNSNAKIISVTEDRLKTIREKYGTDYLMWVGARSYKGTSFTYTSALLLNFLMLNFLPYSIFSTFEKDHELEMFYIMIDLKHNEMVSGDYMDVSYMKDNQNLMTIHLNAFLNDINEN